MRALRRIIGRLAALAALALAATLFWAMARGRPQDLPWTPLDLGEPAGLFTGRKLAALGRTVPRCRALLDRAGVRYDVVPARHDGAACGYGDAVRFATGGARRIAFTPRAPTIACPVAAALAMWEWDVLQPAALRHLGTRVVAIEHLGSYNCRRMYGRTQGAWSEHATADAIDVAGFVLADGRHVTVLHDWKGAGEEAAFLKAARDGACGLFATVLSPDYNAAHRDHLHLDQADRGTLGWRACR